MKLLCLLVVLCVPILISCDDNDLDGYRLEGEVVRASDNSPLAGVEVQTGWETSFEFQTHSVTEDDGRFTFYSIEQATEPTREIFRFNKTGYISREVRADSARVTEDGVYHLIVEMSLTAP